MENATNEMDSIALPVSIVIWERCPNLENFVKEFCDKDETYPHGFDITFDTGRKTRVKIDFLAVDFESFGEERDSAIRSAILAFLDTIGRAWIAWRTKWLQTKDWLPTNAEIYLFELEDIVAITK